MNWEKLKTFLIILFAVLNIFLIFVNLSKNNKFSKIDDSTITDTVKILKKNNIDVNKELISKNIINLNVIELKNIVVSQKFPKNYNTIDTQNFSVNINNNLKSEMNIKKALSSIGINDNLDIVTNGNTSTATLKIKGFPVFGAKLDIKNQNNIINVSGNWYSTITKPKKNTDTSGIVPITGILIDFSNTINSESKISIKNIELGYYIETSQRKLSQINITAVPCYKIITSDKNSYYYNARNGEYLK